jgi:hypothetical protein
MDKHVDDVNAAPIVHSNAVVESHFRNLKHSTMGKKKHLRPGETVRKELTYVQAKFNEAALKNCTQKFTEERESRKRSHFVDDAVEKWAKRRKSRGYSNRDIARKHLFASTSNDNKVKTRTVTVEKKNY